MRFEERSKEAENKGIYDHIYEKNKQSERSYKQIKNIEMVDQK